MAFGGVQVGHRPYFGLPRGQKWRLRPIAETRQIAHAPGRIYPSLSPISNAVTPGELVRDGLEFAPLANETHAQVSQSPIEPMHPGIVEVRGAEGYDLL